jgi:hypothetical protein
MSEMYKLAAQAKLRFASKRGELTVEDLFQLPLTSKTGFDLNTLAVGVSKQLKDMGEESFVEEASTNPQKQVLTLSLDILKDVIKTQQEANKAALARRERQAEIQKIRDLIVQKKDEKLAGASLEDLEAKLKALSESA